MTEIYLHIVARTCKTSVLRVAVNGAIVSAAMASRRHGITTRSSVGSKRSGRLEADIAMRDALVPVRENRHFKPCMTEIYIHIDARMADYMEADIAMRDALVPGGNAERNIASFCIDTQSRQCAQVNFMFRREIPVMHRLNCIVKYLHVAVLCPECRVVARALQPCHTILELQVL